MNKATMQADIERLENEIGELQREVKELKSQGWRDGPVPEGNHVAEVVAIGEKMTHRGNPYLQLDLRVDGYKQLVFLRLVAAGINPLVRGLEDMGLSAQIDWLGSQQAMIGKKCRIRIVHEEYGGRKMPQVRSLEALR